MGQKENTMKTKLITRYGAIGRAQAERYVRQGRGQRVAYWRQDATRVNCFERVGDQVGWRDADGWYTAYCSASEAFKRGWAGREN